MEIVAIVGSPRVNGNTNYLTDQALKEAEKLDINTDKIILARYQINPCQAHSDCKDLISCYQDDDLELILSKVYEADGIIVASPVYFYNVTAQMKIFIDRNIFRYRRNKKMKAKSVGIIVVAGGAGLQETVDSLARFIKITTNIAADKIFRVCGFVGATGAIEDNAQIVESARNLGRDMAKQLLDT